MTMLVSVIDVLALPIVMYMTAFFAINAGLWLVSWRAVGHALELEQASPARDRARDTFLPRVTLLVPAYNEEVTICESIRSLLRLEYPAFEIVICSDGSRDRTVDVLIEAFGFVRTEIVCEPRIPTARVRAFYEVRTGLPAGVSRLLLIEKDNGGKADALNACINLARGEFVTSMDADSLLTRDALLLATRPIVTDPSVVAVGVQVGLTNGSVVEDGVIRELCVPSTWIARFQAVEYMRSFAQGRVGLASIDSLLVLSGVFALLRCEEVLAIGGFLTPRVQARLAGEYCVGAGHTVCEDMEIVVRLHRYLLDHERAGRIVILPFAAAWTEAPESYRDLGKQRARWYRGLLEVLRYHRAMLFDARFRRIGWFSLPYQLLFEAAAPLLEMLGYLLIPIAVIAGALSPSALATFVLLALALNFALTTASVLLCVCSARPVTRGEGMAVVRYARVRDIIVLLGSAALSNFGYRQYLIAWQLKGLWDFARSKHGWDKFARRGFTRGRA